MSVLLGHRVLLRWRRDITTLLVPRTQLEHVSQQLRDGKLPADNLVIYDVMQKSFVKVDEKGTEAAAATSVVIGPTSAPPSITFDRPFLFAIRERFSGTILFMGVIGDPGV